MTRETKIGLLVGLAFIIMIGILLEGHFSSLTEPRPANMADAGDVARQSTAVPGSVSPAPMISAPAPEPRYPVPAYDETSSARPVRVIESTGGSAPVDGGPGVANVDIGPGAGRPLAGAGRPIVEPYPTVNPGHVHDNGRPTGAAAGTGTTLAELARRNGEELVDPNNVDSLRGAMNGGRVNDAARPPAGPQQYVAMPGDSLGKIARKHFGVDSKAARDAIAGANPSLHDNPNLVVAGKTYAIPAALPSPANYTPPTPAPARAETPTPRPADVEAEYIAKQGDTLWGIAVSQCGGGSAVGAIKELNRDLLDGGDIIRPGMKLRLPAKLASAH